MVRDVVKTALEVDKEDVAAHEQAYCSRPSGIAGA
jgi:hypothetical protein